jgi:proteic killer suppression protein
MIRAFSDETTEDIWNGVNSRAARRIPKSLWRVIQRKLDQIDSVSSVEALRIPPGNRLHALTGDRAGRHAIRVNDQYRIVFRFQGRDAYDVCCTHYH